MTIPWKYHHFPVFSSQRFMTTNVKISQSESNICSVEDLGVYKSQNPAAPSVSMLVSCSR